MAAQTLHARGVTPTRRGESVARPGSERRWKGSGEAGGRSPGQAGNGPKPPAEHAILFQQYFKSIGPRTYAAQVKRAGNGNHYLVLTEGKRDDTSAPPRLTRLFVFSEDFPEFFKLMRAAAEFIKATPVPPEVAMKRRRHWEKQRSGGGEMRVQQGAPKR